jgi:hypothetical protein
MKRMTKLSAVSSALAIAGALAFSGPVRADQVKGDYISYQGGNITVNADGSSDGGGGGRFTFDRDALSSGTEFQGTLVTNGGPTDVGGTDELFYAVCLEPNENLVDPDVFNVVALENAPSIGVSGAMGLDRAKDMRILFGNVYPDFSQAISTADAIALQIAVWEIANETYTSSGDPVYNVNGGSSDSGIIWTTNQDTARNTAQGWLDKINDGTWTIEAKGLVGLVSTTSGRQDFVAQVVPIPAAVWLFGSALVGAVGLGRRKPKVEA